MAQIKIIVKCISILTFFFHPAFSQKQYYITSYKILTLDKQVQVRNGQGYYNLGAEKRENGIIKVLNTKIEVSFGLGDPDFSASIKEVKSDDGKTIYNCLEGVKKVEFLVFQGSIYGDKKIIKIQLQTDYDNTLKLWSQVYVFQTWVELSEQEKEEVKDIRNKEIAERQRAELIKDSNASKYPKYFNEEILEAFFVRKTKRGLLLCWINEEKSITNFSAAYNSLKDGRLRYNSVDKVKVSENIKQELKNVFSEKTDGDYYISINISHARKEVEKNKFIDKYEEDTFIAVREFQKIKGYKSNAITWDYKAIETYP